jgi:N-acetylglucosaminyl-diphospho-decaprenol L-rhamnosyltransferase
MADRPELSIVIVHWNTPELLECCLGSIRERERRLRAEIIVVDNASRESIAGRLRKIGMPNLRLAEFGENIGFGRACNLGARMARAEMLLFLGPDTACIQDDAIKDTLGAYVSLPNAGAVSCLLVNEDGSPQRHYFNLPRPDRLIAEWLWEVTNHIPAVYRARQARVKPKLEKVDMVIAHWMMVSQNAFNKAGGFPNDAFMFGDDIEINKKLLDAGYSNYLFRNCRALHQGGSSTKGRYGDRLQYVVQDSITKFCIKHYGPLLGTLSILLIILRAVLNIIILGPLYVTRGFKDFFMDNWTIIWHYLAYQWRRHEIRRIAGWR